MSTDLFDFDDWGSFVRRGLLVVCALAVSVFVVATLVFWMHGIIQEPKLSRTTTAIFAQPNTASGWLGLALLSGAWFGLGAMVLGLVVLGVGALLGVLGQGLEARRVSKKSISEIAAEARGAAESEFHRSGDAT